MTTQREAVKALNNGGRIQNNLLLDGEGKPIGNLKQKQVDALMLKRSSVSFGYDGTVTIR
ncbi:hypothetical protein [Adonisia turfae]|nr:hypothetical protein [Adonisia turfae]